MGIAVFPAAGGGVRQYTQEITGTTTWTAPSGCNAVEVFLVGGGGGAGALTFNGSGQVGGGGGGGGGEVLRQMVSVTPGATYTVTIGGGGAGSTSGTTAGAVGGDTTFGALATAQGGGGGWSGNQPNSTMVAGTDRATQGGFPVEPFQYGGRGSSAGGAGGPGEARTPASTGTVFNSRVFLATSNVMTVPKTRGARSPISTAASAEDSLAWYGGMGVDGFGGGGTSFARGQTGFGSITVGNTISTDGAAAPTIGTSSMLNGQNAATNRGGGGGGGGTLNSSASGATVNGGNGGSGYARLTWWA